MMPREEDSLEKQVEEPAASSVGKAGRPTKAAAKALKEKHCAEFGD